MALPEPSFITRDPAAIVAEMVASYEATTGKTLQPAQVERVLIDLIAYRENLIRIGIQEAAKQNLVEYAIFPMIDYLGELVGVARLVAQSARCTIRFYLTAAQAFNVTVPAGTRVETKDGQQIFATEFNLTITAGQAFGDVSAICQTAGVIGNGYVAGDVNNLVDVVANVNSAANTTTTSGGSDEESDDAMRARIKLAPESFSTAGSRGSYLYHAKSADSSIVDVAIDSPSPGVVAVYPLCSTGVPTQAVIDAVLATCSAEDVRPLTDDVQVLAPTPVDYTIAVTVTPYQWSDRELVQQQATAALTALASEMQGKLGQDVTTSRVIAAAHLDGVYRVTVQQPAADLSISFSQFARCVSITVTLMESVNG